MRGDIMCTYRDSEGNPIRKIFPVVPTTRPIHVGDIMTPYDQDVMAWYVVFRVVDPEFEPSEKKRTEDHWAVVRPQDLNKIIARGRSTATSMVADWGQTQATYS